MRPDRFVTKEQWGSTLGRQATPASHPIGATHGVTLHWEGPHMGDFPHSECAAHVRGIERFHEQDRGWADLAYSAIVCPHGWTFEGRGVGTMTAANGDNDTNDDWYAICYLGGEGDGFTDEGKAAFHDAVAWLRADGDAGPEVNGHRDHKATTCPGDEIYRWLNSHDFDTQEDDMSQYAKQLDRIERQTKKNGRLTWNRDQKILDGLGAVLDALEGKATKGQARRILDELRAEVEAEQPEADDGA